jgi:hypothetical protein
MAPRHVSGEICSISGAARAPEESKGFIDYLMPGETHGSKSRREQKGDAGSPARL